MGSQCSGREAGAERAETIELTSRGRPVALLTPLPEHATARERLIAAGRLTPARRRLADLGPPPEAEVTGSTGAALAEERDERLAG